MPFLILNEGHGLSWCRVPASAGQEVSTPQQECRQRCALNTLRRKALHVHPFNGHDHLLHVFVTGARLSTRLCLPPKCVQSFAVAQLSSSPALSAPGGSAPHHLLCFHDLLQCRRALSLLGQYALCDSLAPAPPPSGGTPLQSLCCLPIAHPQATLAACRVHMESLCMIVTAITLPCSISSRRYPHW